MHTSTYLTFLLPLLPSLIAAHNIQCFEGVVKRKIIRDARPSPAEVPVGAVGAGMIPYVIINIDSQPCTGLTDTAGSCLWDKVGPCKLSGPGWCSSPGATAVMENGMWTLSDDSGYKAMCRNNAAGGHHAGCPSTEDVTASGAPVSGFAPGWCGIHVVQHQKPNPATDNYKFDISLFDNDGVPIGGVSGADAPTGTGVGVDSQLPNVMVVTAGPVDSSVVSFAYGDQSFGSTDQQHHCNFAVDFDSGTHTRSGDCGFSC